MTTMELYSTILKKRPEVKRALDSKGAAASIYADQ